MTTGFIKSLLLTAALAVLLFCQAAVASKDARFTLQ